MSTKQPIQRGAKMIQFHMNLWTNNLPKGSNEKTAWASGVLHITANKPRGIKADHIHVRSMHDFFEKLTLLLGRNNIKLLDPDDEPPSFDLRSVGKK